MSWLFKHKWIPPIGGILLVLGVLTMGSAFLGQTRAAECQITQSNVVGAYRCKSCHQAEYKTWANSAHAKGYSSLTGKDRKNPMCLSCHTTGTASHLQGVQCESCHGGGRNYARNEVMLDSKLSRALGLKVVKGVKGCIGCHSKRSPKLRPFHYKKMWKKIAHGSNKP